jgi:hypothetical protein
MELDLSINVLVEENVFTFAWGHVLCLGRFGDGLLLALSLEGYDWHGGSCEKRRERWNGNVWMDLEY